MALVQPASDPEVLPPHPPIAGYYDTAAQKRAYLTSIFDETAADYDKVERWLSFGSGSWYRRQALERTGLRPGMRIADVATGTGLVAREALAVVGAKGVVVGIDPSAGMLARAKEALGIETRVATAEALPFEGQSFDFVSMGYALRHMEDLGRAFREFFRVLRPGGRVCVLEITRPKTNAGRMFLHAYLGTLSAVIARIAKLSPRTPELWRYYWETIDRCVEPERVMAALSAAGFSDVQRTVSCGIFSEYVGTRPQSQIDLNAAPVSPAVV
jgi:demethylmenaquinone methyltransferase/2-methoxy-6-polyprenyl-1,4-benzoquinol methylase